MPPWCQLSQIRCHFCLIHFCTVTGRAPKCKLISPLIGADPWMAALAPPDAAGGEAGWRGPPSVASLITGPRQPREEARPHCLLSLVSCLKWHAGEKKMRIHNGTQVGSYLREFHKTCETSHGANSFLRTSAQGSRGGISHFFLCHGRSSSFNGKSFIWTHLWN